MVRMSTFSRRLMISAALAGTTSIATKKPVPASAQASGEGWKALRKQARTRAREEGEKRLRVGVIGAGLAGSALIQRLVSRERNLKDVEMVAVCDVYRPRLDRAVALAQLDPQNGHADYRQLLVRKDVDAVAIATPSHWHFRMTMDAMNAGKDVYLEPPMGLVLEEAQQIALAAGSLKQVLQLNCPEVQDPRYKLVKELVLEGAVGKLLSVVASVSSNAIEGEWNEYVEEEASLETLDWEAWQGPAVRRPFSGERFFRWRKYWDYSGGAATETLFYKLAPLLAALGPQLPLRVSSSGGIFVHKDREVPDTYTTLIEYPEFQINLLANTATAGPGKFLGEGIYGNTGTITVGKNSVELHRETVWEAKSPESKRGTHAFEVNPQDMFEEHFNDFIDAVRARRQPFAGVDFGLAVTTPLLLGMDSYRESKMKNFDFRTRRVSDRPAPRLGYEGNGRNNPDGKKRRA
jgi:predicted dehydrogenase